MPASILQGCRIFAASSDRPRSGGHRTQTAADFFERRPPRGRTRRRRLRIQSLERRQLLAAEITLADLADLPVDLSAKADPVGSVLGGDLWNLNKQAEAGENLSATGPLSNVPFAFAGDGSVGVDVIARGNAQQTREDLSELGFRESGHFGTVVSGQVRPELLDEIAGLPSVQFVKPHFGFETNAGRVVNEADASMRTDIAKQRFGLDGDGIKIGVISDSFNRIGGAPAGIASGDLPGPGNPEGRTTPVQIVEESTSSSNIDEGRAMIELIHDIAPEADLAFHTAGNSSAVMAQGILDLAAAGSDVIVDDITFFDQPFFQDGILAQAADQVVAQGVPFFSSAGNQGSRSYEATFRDGGTGTINGQPYRAHDFDPGPGIDAFQLVALPPGATERILFQWDQPFASAGGTGSASDLDIFVFDFQTEALITGSAQPNLNGDALEIFELSNPDPNNSAFFNIFIGQNLNVGGPTPTRVKYIYYNGRLDIGEFDEVGGTLYQHHQAAGGAGIAAAFYQDTPAFGTSPAQPQATTSTGNVPILFDTAGNRLAAPVVRDQPRVTAPDGTNTTFFIDGVDVEGDGNFNFFGTSAAAPHVAAVAGLMLESAGGPGSLSPQTIYTTIEQTALEMGTPGFDFVTGHGFIDGEAAIEAVRNPGNGGGDELSGNVLFSALTSGNDRELHITDGTATGTKLLKNLGGSGSGSPLEITEIGDTAYFTARLGSGERELFKTDGTTAGTRLVRNLSGSNSSAPRDLTAVGNQLYFTARRPDGQRELFRSGGTSASTVQVEDLSGNTSSDPQDLTAVGNRLFFTAVSPDGQRELFISRGSASNTRRVRDISGPRTSNPQDLTAVGNLLYFTARLPSGERELFVSDGTSAGTKLVRNLSGATNSYPRELTAVGNRLFFSARLPNGQRELFRSRGTSGSTVLVENLPGNPAPQDLVAIGDVVYFSANNNAGQRELYRSDGTASGTFQVRNLSGSVNSDPRDLIRVGNRIAFTAKLPSGERELFRSNGTSGGTKLVKNLAGTRSGTPTQLVRVGNEVVFVASLANGQREIHRSDLTNAGTKLIRNLAGSTSSLPNNLSTYTSSGGNAAMSSFIVSAFSTGGSEAEDVNADGQIDPLDALAVINRIRRQRQATAAAGEAFDAATLSNGDAISMDVDRDGTVDAVDALKILNRIMADRVSPPAVSGQTATDAAMATIDIIDADDNGDEWTLDFVAGDAALFGDAAGPLF